MLSRGVKAPIVQALTYKTNTVLPMTTTPQATGTPYPTVSPFPTVDYRATDQAWQLSMEHERGEIIKAQAAHDEEMMRQQVNLVSIGATGTAYGTEVSLQQSMLTHDAGMMTAQSARITATAHAPTQVVAMSNSIRAVENSKRDDIISTIGVLVLIFFLLSLSLFLLKKTVTLNTADYINGQQEEPEPKEPPHLREDRGSGDFSKWYVPCSEQQLTELAEMVVNGERTLAINRIETTSRTLKRPVLTKLRKFFRMNDFAIELGGGEISLNDRAVCFIQGWFDNHELEQGYQFLPSPAVGN